MAIDIGSFTNLDVDDEVWGMDIDGKGGEFFEEDFPGFRAHFIGSERKALIRSPCFNLEASGARIYGRFGYRFRGPQDSIHGLGTHGSPGKSIEARTMPQDELGARREPLVDKKEEAPWVFLDGAADVAKALVQLLYESSREFFLVFFF